MGYVPHSTHLCQGLDVAVFGVHKVHWAQECKKFEQESGRTIRKEDFLLVHAHAIQRTFKKETILSAWEKTGLHPFNPNVITPDMVAPSTATSTHTLQLFPAAQPTPVHWVVQCMYQWMHADQPLSPAAQLPLERGPDSAIDPALANPPPKNLSVDGLMTSLWDTSVAFLTNSSSVTSGDKLPPFQASTGPSCALLKKVAFAPMPTAQKEWEDIQSGVVDICHRYDSACGQIVLQNGHNIALQKQLFAKEHKKKKSQVHVALQKQRILTDDEFMELLKLAKADRAQAVAKKKEQAQERKAKVKWREQAQIWKQKAISDHKIKRCTILTKWEVAKAAARAEQQHQPPKPRVGKRESTPETYRTFNHADWLDSDSPGPAEEGVEGKSDLESFFIP